MTINGVIEANAQNLYSELDAIFKLESAKHLQRVKAGDIYPNALDERRKLVVDITTFVTAEIILHTEALRKNLIKPRLEDRLARLSRFKQAAYYNTLEKTIALIQAKGAYVEAALRLCEPALNDDLRQSQILRSRAYVYAKQHMQEPAKL